ncbi:sulfotransferase family protein [Luteirhabdus pelagi]|uniref:sulfotransferase family protein n=1 Tax=Luteirhabdus pelagi TaxID=2792783 RepID=UPI00193A9371|nr:sulfotransferase family protein [Luteirhabdus pelagi]
MRPSSAWLKGLWRRVTNSRSQKVFIIGFHKTGTTTIGKALLMLGYTVCGSLKEGYGYSKFSKEIKNDLMEHAGPLLKRYDAFQDTPWYLLYEELYNLYPDAHFILTVRETDAWLKSVQKHFGKGRYPYHDVVYGSHNPIDSPKIYSNRIEDHNNSVRKFFSEKGNFMMFSVKEDGWNKLCEFLQCSKPIWKFPHANKAGAVPKGLRKLKTGIKNIFYN